MIVRWRREAPEAPLDLEVVARHSFALARVVAAVEAADLMEQHRITSLLVVDEAERLVGAINTNDLLRAKVI